MGTRYFIGVDLHKNVIQVCVLDEKGRIVEEKRFRYASLEDGLKIVECLLQWGPNCRVVVEALGLNRWFVNACLKAGLDVVVADAVKLNLRILGKKTDRRDAHELARRLRLGDIDKNARTYYPSDEQYGYRKLLRGRHRLVSIRQQLVNQLRAFLNAYCLPAPRGSLYTGPSIGKLRACSFPTSEMDLTFQTIVDILEALQASIQKLTKEVEACAARDKDTAVAMANLPQVAAQTALTIVHELGDVRRFKNAKAAASHAGLVPRVANSADKSHHGRITKRGNRELRWILSQWAVRLLAHEPRVATWAQRKRRRMHLNKVRIELARRLLVGVYKMLSTGEVFDLERCLGVSNA